MPPSSLFSVSPFSRLAHFMRTHLRWPYRDDLVFTPLALGVFFIPLAFVLYVHEPFESIKTTLLLSATGCSLFFFSFRRPRHVRADKTFFICCALFLLSAVLSTLHSADLLTGFFGLLFNYYRLPNSVLFYAAWVLFTLMLIQTLTREKLVFLLKGLLVVCFVVSLFGVVQSFGFSYYEGLNAPSILRAPSFVGNPNFAAMFVAALMPFLIYAWSKAVNFWPKLFYLLNAVFSSCALILFNSRGALLGLAVALVVSGISWLYVGVPKRVHAFLAVFTIMTGLLAGAFLGVVRPSLVSATVNLSETTVVQRFLVWDQARGMLMAHPFAGVGLSQFLPEFEKNRGTDLGNSALFDDAHNIFLNFGAMGGFPLLLSFIGLCVVVCLRAIRDIQKDRDWLVGATLAGFLGLLVSACFTPVPVTAWLLLAVFMGALVSRGAVVSTTTPHVIFRLVVRGLGTVLVVAGVCFISAEAIFFSGISAYGRSEFATAYERVQLARKLDPINAYFDWYAGYTTLFYKQDPALVDAVMNRLKRLHSSFGMTYNQTGNLNFLLYKKTGDRKYLTRAIEDFRQLTIRDPLASESYIYLYYFSDIAGDRTQAVQALRYSIVTNPEDVRTWMLLAKQYQSQGDRKRTSFTLEKAFALKPDIPAVKQAWFSMKNGTPLAQVDIPILVQFSGLQ